MVLGKTLRAIGSLWFAAVLLVLLLVAMACATVFESVRGTEQALAAFYSSWWFELLLALLAVSILSALLLRFPFSKRQVGFVLTHAALLVTFAGALVTKHFAVDGQVGLFEGQTVDHFTADGDTLIVENVQDDKRATVDLSGSLSGRFRPGEVRGAPLLSLGELRVEVVRYLPDSEWARRVLDDNPTLQPAIEVSLSPSGHDEPQWVLVGHPAEIGGVEVSYRPVADRAELDRLLSPASATGLASKGIVRIEHAGTTFQFPLEEGLEKPVPLGDTGYTARVLRYLPHATVGPDSQVVSASDRPVNPYIEVELVGPDVSETRKAFARFPDFGAMHGPRPAAEFKLTFVATFADAPATPLEVLSGPDGELYARFSRGAAEVVTHKLDVGRPVDSPWAGRKFAVLRRYDHARVARLLDPVEPVRATRQPAILLRLAAAGHTSEAWLQKQRRRQVTIGGTLYDLAYANRSVPLGFSLKLERFRVGYYPGTRRPRSFESHVTITDPNSGRRQSRVVSMNRPTSFGRYTLYQSSYRQDGGRTASFLSVSRDPGQPIVFAGYVGLMIGMLVVLGTRVAQHRRNAQSATRASLAVAAVLLVTAGSSAAELPDTLDLTTLRALAVQHDGRWPPLDTVARDVVESVTGDEFYHGHDPLVLLLAWTFDWQRWTHEPLISIDNAELRAELRLPAAQTVFSYVELTEHRHLQTLMHDLAHVEGRKLDPLESKVSEISEKLVLLERVFDNEVIRPVPDPEDVVGGWRPIALSPDGTDEIDSLSAMWAELGEAFLENDSPAFAAASQRLAETLRGLPAAHRPRPGLIAAELRYNRLAPFRTAWMMMVVGALLAGAAMLVRRKWFDGLAVVALIAGFAVLSYGLSLRWQIAGRIPATNMYESLLFLSWGMGAFAILAMLVLREPIVPLTTFVMGAASLILADVLPLDHFIRPIVPVLLDTIWMSIHVPIIMVSYSVLALAVLIAHVQLVVLAAVPGRHELAARIDSLHYWYVHVGVILLAAGIITGSMWAASSWGRYWGWDPKEVWSLVALLGYMVILHVRVGRERVTWWMQAVAALLGIGLFVLVVLRLGPLSGPKLLALAAAAAAMVVFVRARGLLATALKSILAFWLIIMTYVGVNYVLGSPLHAYAFGTGAVIRWLFLVGGIDLTLIALCCLLYAARYSAPVAAANGAAE